MQRFRRLQERVTLGGGDNTAYKQYRIADNYP